MPKMNEQYASQTKQALGDIGDIAQDANNVTAKIALRLRNQELADEAKAVFERLLVLNTTLTFMLSQADHHSLENDLETFNILAISSLPGLETLMELPEMIERGFIRQRRTAAQLVRNMLKLLAFSDVDMTALSSMSNVAHPAKPAEPVTEETKHDVLLALVRAYRFMIEATPEMLAARRTSRMKLLRQVRALEMKAAISGIET